MALEHQQEFIGVKVAMPVVPGTGRKNSPAKDQLIRVGRFLVNQELDLHVDPAIFG
jgi:hypothetical protein